MMNTTASRVFQAVTIFFLLAAPAARAAALPGPDVPGSMATRAFLAVQSVPSLGNWEVTGDSDWYGVPLVKGVTYAFFLDKTGDARGFTLTLHGPAGNNLAQSLGGTYNDAGFEYTPALTATYYLAATLLSFDGGVNGGYMIAVAPDCLGNAKTSCLLTAGIPQSRWLRFSSDVDTYKAVLQPGQSYTFQAQDPDGLLSGLEVTLLDPQGKVISTGTAIASLTWQITGYQPTKAGTYLVRVRNSTGHGYGSYTIGMTVDQPPRSQRH